MQVELKEHVVEKSTNWGPVKKSLNQYFVFIENTATKQMSHAGFIGTQEGALFMPLTGFPPELVAAASKSIGQKLGREVKSAVPPKVPVAEQQAMIFEDDETE